jgi:hypothetical protein
MNKDDKYLVSSKPVDQEIKLTQKGESYVREKDSFEHGIEHMGNGIREWTKNLLSGQIIHDETTPIEPGPEGLTVTITEPPEDKKVGGVIKI